MERSKERSGTRQIALGLCDTRLVGEGIHVVRRDIENLHQVFAALRENDEEEYWKAHAGEQGSTLRGSSRSASLKYASLRSHWPRLRVT